MSRWCRGREEIEFNGVRIVVDPGEKLGYYAYFLPDDLAWEIWALIECSRDARTIVDVGANAGVVSLMAARHLPHAKVIAFEPEPHALSAFETNLECNPALRNQIEVVSKAVGYIDGVVSFAQPTEVNLGTGHVVTRGCGDLEVASVRLDSFFQGKPAPDVIKIDVEGAELDVLKGGAKTLARGTRAVLVELHGFLMPEGLDFNRRVIRQLQEWGFDTFDLNRSGRTRIDDLGSLRPRMQLLGLLRADQPRSPQKPDVGKPLTE